MGNVPSLAAQLGDAIHTIRERDAEIAALRAQVAELEAWKDAVPVLAINALHYEAGGGMITQSQDDDIREWLFAVMQK